MAADVSKSSKRRDFWVMYVISNAKQCLLHIHICRNVNLYHLRRNGGNFNVERVK